METIVANLFLANYGDYLKGAKDPDNVFKDFENHVHPKKFLARIFTWVLTGW